MSTWRTATPCRGCPFDTSQEAGRRQRQALRPARWRGILRDLRAGAAFQCHKTTRETGNGSQLLCAGALAWQEARGVSSNVQRAMEAIDYFEARRNAKRNGGTPDSTAAATTGQGVAAGPDPALPGERPADGRPARPGGR